MSDSTEGSNDGQKTYIPKVETQASDFIKRFPDYCGNDVVIAILDTGISPNTPGICKDRVVDYVDCTGNGDVLMVPMDFEGDDNKVVGLSHGF